MSLGELETTPPAIVLAGRGPPLGGSQAAPHAEEEVLNVMFVLMKYFRPAASINCTEPVAFGAIRREEGTTLPCECRACLASLFAWLAARSAAFSEGVSGEARETTLPPCLCWACFASLFAWFAALSAAFSSGVSGVASSWMVSSAFALRARRRMVAPLSVKETSASRAEAGRRRQRAKKNFFTVKLLSHVRCPLSAAVFCASVTDY